LNDRGQRLFSHAARLEKCREVAPLAQLGDAQFDGACAGLPSAIAVAVAVIDPVGIALAVGGASQALDLKLHQTLRRKSHHHAQQIGIGRSSPAS